MRALEILLLLANLLTLLVLLVPRLHAPRWMRHSATVALVIAVAQLLLERPRWQMFPAYGLTGLFFLVSLLGNVVPASSSSGPKRAKRIVAGLGS